MASNSKTVSRQQSLNGQQRKIYNVTGLQCIATTAAAVAVARFFVIHVYNKSLNDWSLRKQFILFPSNFNVSLGGALEMRW